MVMAASFVATHDHGLSSCGYLLSWPLLLWICMAIAATTMATLVLYYCRYWILMVMTVTIVEYHIHIGYYCGYSWSLPLSLCILMVMTVTIVATHVHGLNYCGYSWIWQLILWIRMIMHSTIVDIHRHDLYYCGC